MVFDSAPASPAIIPGTFGESAPALSPDGKWLAYQSDETGQMEVYVRPYPGPGARVPVSLQGGTEPAWAHSGRELFFRAGDSLMAAAVTLSPAFAVTGRGWLFTGAFVSGEASANTTWRRTISTSSCSAVARRGPRCSGCRTCFSGWCSTETGSGEVSPPPFAFASAGDRRPRVSPSGTSRARGRPDLAMTVLLPLRRAVPNGQGGWPVGERATPPSPLPSAAPAR